MKVKFAAFETRNSFIQRIAESLPPARRSDFEAAASTAQTSTSLVELAEKFVKVPANMTGRILKDVGAIAYRLKPDLPLVDDYAFVTKQKKGAFGHSDMVRLRNPKGSERSVLLSVFPNWHRLFKDLDEDDIDIILSRGLYLSAHSDIDPDFFHGDRIEKFLAVCPGAVGLIPEHLLTSELCYSAVVRSAAVVKSVPQSLINKDIWVAAVSKDGDLIKEVPAEFYCDELFLAAVGNRGAVLEHVPTERRTREICLAAIKQNGIALRWTPEEYIDREMFELAIWNNASLYKIPREFLDDKEFLLKLVRKDRYALHELPRELQTYDVCLAAVSAGNSEVSSLPEEFQTREMYMASFLGGGDMAASRVPREWRDAEMCMAAAEADGRNLRHFPEDVINEKMCFEGVRHKDNYGHPLNCVPAKYMSQRLCNEAVKYDPKAIGHVPAKYRNPDMIRDAITREAYAATYLSAKEIPIDLWPTILKDRSDSFPKTPKSLRTKEFVLKLRKMGICVSYYLKKNMKDELFWVDLINIAPEDIPSVPKKLKRSLLPEAAIQAKKMAKEHLAALIAEDRAVREKICSKEVEAA